MRKSLVMILAAIVVATAVPAFADLQTVQVGGEIRIRGDWFMNAYTSGNINPVRWPAFTLPARQVSAAPILSGFAWDERENDVKLVEMRTRLSVKADFTNEVSALIELDSYDFWGEDFRSDYITGADFAAVSNDDVEIYQAYIEASEMWGYPIRARIGRQEIALGSQWLVGVNDTSAFFSGLSFDAIRLTYGDDIFTVDAIAALLDENTPVEQDEDVWMYALYGSYLGLEDIVIDAYGIWIRDARSVNDTNFFWFAEWIEDIFNVDDYDVTNLYTVGLRGSGQVGAFDFELEGAYQFGDADQVGSLFVPFTYGDDDAEFEAWGANAELGFSFDMDYSPRVFIGGAWLDGEDNRDITFWDWINPFDRSEASVSFNRLFSNWEYSEFIENTALSNSYIFRAGVSAMPTERIELLLAAAYFMADDERLLRRGIFGWRDITMDEELGLELGLYADYHYSEDLVFRAGYAHFFADDGLGQQAARWFTPFRAGNAVMFNGLAPVNGDGDDDYDYLFVETELSF